MKNFKWFWLIFVLFFGIIKNSDGGCQSQLNAKNAIEVKEIYSSTRAVGIFEFDSIQEYTLTNIAIENPISGGQAVYIARVVIGISIDDFIFNSNRQLNNISSVNNNIDNEVLITPNPANDKIIVVFLKSLDAQLEIEIINNLGKVIYRNSIIEEQNIIDTKGFSSGIYLIKFSKNKILFSTRKLIISH